MRLALPCVQEPHFPPPPHPLPSPFQTENRDAKYHNLTHPVYKVLARTLVIELAGGRGAKKDDDLCQFRDH
jgi:hypothetical protein